MNVHVPICIRKYTFKEQNIDFRIGGENSGGKKSGGEKSGGEKS